MVVVPVPELIAAVAIFVLSEVKITLALVVPVATPTVPPPILMPSLFTPFPPWPMMVMSAPCELTAALAPLV